MKYNILVCGPYFSDNEGTISKHNAEVGVVEALRELGQNVVILDYRHGLLQGEDFNEEDADIILCLGPGLTSKNHEWLDKYKGFKVLWNSEPLRLENYYNKMKEQVGHFDYYFTFDESEIPIYHELGIKNISFLPQAYNPDFYTPLDIMPQWDLCFVGSIGGKWNNRQHFLNRVLKFFPQTNIMQGIFDAEKVNKIYNNHKIILNLGLYCPQSGPPNELRAFGLQQRIFETIGAGSVVVTNEIPEGTNDLFADKKNILFYNKNNLEDVIRYGLDNINRMGIEENILNIREQHTYKARMTKMIEILKNV